MVSGKSGVTVGAEKAFDAATKKGIAKLFFVNKLDNENADFYKVFEELKTRFGPMVAPSWCPMWRTGGCSAMSICSSIRPMRMRTARRWNARCRHGASPGRPAHRDQRGGRGDDEELMEKYFSGEDFTPRNGSRAWRPASRRGEIAPVFCGSAQELEGVDQLLNGLIWLAPWAETVAGETGTDAAGNPVEIEPNETAPVSGRGLQDRGGSLCGKTPVF